MLISFVDSILRLYMKYVRSHPDLRPNNKQIAIGIALIVPVTILLCALLIVANYLSVSFLLSILSYFDSSFAIYNTSQYLSALSLIVMLAPRSIHLCNHDHEQMVEIENESKAIKGMYNSQKMLKALNDKMFKLTNRDDDELEEDGITKEDGDLLYRRIEFVKNEMAKRGWGPDPGGLSIEQVLEIRKMPEWKDPPKVDTKKGDIN